LIKIKITEKAKRQIKKINKEESKKIEDLLEFLEISAFPRGYDIKRMKGYEKEKIYRIRSGNYRILYTLVSNEEIVILSIARRKSIYK